VYVNLTPHVVKVRTESGIVEFPPSGIVARRRLIASEPVYASSVAVRMLVRGTVDDLPPPVEGVVYICSAIAAEAASRLGRRDVVSPDSRRRFSQRDDSGHVTIVDGFLMHMDILDSLDSPGVTA